jgi:hypothetical protein
MKDYNQTSIVSPIDDLFVSVNDIYEQYDEGKIDYHDSEQILMRICKHFLLSQWEQNQALDHSIRFEKATDCFLWLEENEILTPVTLTLHLGE